MLFFQADLLTLEGNIGRLAVLGVTAASLLSGYGSVDTPHAYVRYFRL